MNTTATARCPSHTDTVQLVTFRVADLLLGIDIALVQEITRHGGTTCVPQAPDFVLGAMNLRGDVTTVIDLRGVLGLPAGAITGESRIVIVRFGDERVGLSADGIADILNVCSGEIVPPPPNLSGVDGRFFAGIHMTESDIVVVLDLAAALDFEVTTTSSGPEKPRAHTHSAR